MSDLDKAMLGLAGYTLAFLLAVLAFWWFRRSRAENAPRVPRAAGESRLPKFSRKSAEPVFEPAEIAPSRLARIAAKPAYERLSEENEEPVFEPAAPAWIEPEPESEPEYEAVEAPHEPEPATEPQPPAGVEPLAAADPPAAPMVDEAMLETLVSQVERQAHSGEAPAHDRIFVRLVPQIPPRDPILRSSWIGGRPHLPSGMEWPKVDGTDGDFLAQIACADLPAELWDGLGPRNGWLAFFADPHGGAVTAVHLSEDGSPRDPPRPAGAAYFRAYGSQSADLASLVLRAFPEWPVDLVTVRPGDADPQQAATEDAEALLAADYDAGDPAFHPFDWPSMLAMADLLESRIAQLPVDGMPPQDANDELSQAVEEAAGTNRDAVIRTQEILGIIRESAAQAASFSPTDATAVMAALHAIRWTGVTTETDPESGEDMVEAHTLPLTRYYAPDDLWVGDWRAILFDHLKHAWCQNPDRISVPARAFFEPVWEAMAIRDMASMGNFPAHAAVGFDDDRDVAMIELPSSGVMSRNAGNGNNLVLAIRKADLAAMDFSKLRPLLSN